MCLLCGMAKIAVQAQCFLPICTKHSMIDSIFGYERQHNNMGDGRSFFSALVSKNLSDFKVYDLKAWPESESWYQQYIKQRGKYSWQENHQQSSATSPSSRRGRGLSAMLTSLLFAPWVSQ